MAWFRAHPLATLEPEVVFVQSNGMAEWCFPTWTVNCFRASCCKPLSRARRQFTLIEAQAILLEAAVGQPSMRASGLEHWWR